LASSIASTVDKTTYRSCHCLKRVDGRTFYEQNRSSKGCLSSKPDRLHSLYSPDKQFLAGYMIFLICSSIYRVTQSDIARLLVLTYDCFQTGAAFVEGNNSTCRVVRGTYNRTEYGYNSVVRIPAGANNIEILQYGFGGNSIDDTYIALRDGDTGQLMTLNMGPTLLTLAA